MKQRLSKVEASQELGVSISTIDRMIRRGDLQIEREGTKSNDRVWVILEGEEAAEAGDGASASTRCCRRLTVKSLAICPPFCVPFHYGTGR
jgi:hypothetical protein